MDRIDSLNINLTDSNDLTDLTVLTDSTNLNDSTGPADSTDLTNLTDLNIVSFKSYSFRQFHFTITINLSSLQFIISTDCPCNIDVSLAGQLINYEQSKPIPARIISIGLVTLNNQVLHHYP